MSLESRSGEQLPTPRTDALYDSSDGHSLAAWFKLASELERGLAAKVSTTASIEFAWLIEADATSGKLDYWAGATWSDDANEAVKFHTQADAECVLKMLHNPHRGEFLYAPEGKPRVREHSFFVASERRAPEGWGAKSKDDKDALASACLAFAAMLKEDYGVGKQAALTCITAAYETNEAAK